jgi:hypothetical protein
MAKGGGLIDGHGQGFPAVRETVITAVDTAGFDAVAHKKSLRILKILDL